MIGRTDTIQAQQKAYNDCLRQLDNLVKLKTSPDNEGGGLLADDEYGRERMNLLKEKTRLEELLRDSGQRVEKWLALSEETFAFACAARSRFAKGDSQTKKSILATIGSNLTLKDKKLRIEAMKPFWLLETSVFPREGENKSFEPTNGGLEEDSNDQIHTALPSGLPDLESNQNFRFQRATSYL